MLDFAAGFLKNIDKNCNVLSALFVVKVLQLGKLQVKKNNAIYFETTANEESNVITSFNKKAYCISQKLFQCKFLKQFLNISELENHRLKVI